MTEENSNTRIARNTMLLYSRSLINLLIGLYTLGFAIPFLAVGLFTGTLLNFFKKRVAQVGRKTDAAGGGSFHVHHAECDGAQRQQDHINSSAGDERNITGRDTLIDDPGHQ